MFYYTDTSGTVHKYSQEIDEQIVKEGRLKNSSKQEISEYDKATEKEINNNKVRKNSKAHMIKRIEALEEAIAKK